MHCLVFGCGFFKLARFPSIAEAQAGGGLPIDPSFDRSQLVQLSGTASQDQIGVGPSTLRYGGGESNRHCSIYLKPGRTFEVVIRAL